MSLDGKKLWSIAKGALIAAAGATLAYLAGQGVEVSALVSIVLNAIYQSLKAPIPLPEDQK